MRIPSRRLLLPLVAVLVAVAAVGVVALLGGGRGAAGAGRGGGQGAATPPGLAGTPGVPGQGAALPGDPAGDPRTAGLPRVAGTASTPDLVTVWDGRGGLPVASPAGGSSAPAAAQVKLDLTVRAAAGRALAVVRVRNLTGRRLALVGTLRLLVSGPGPAAVSPLRLNRPLAGGGTSQVTVPFRPGGPGVYRVRAVFTP